MFSLKLVLLACLRIGSPTSTLSYATRLTQLLAYFSAFFRDIPFTTDVTEHRVTLSYNPVNLRPRISTKGAVEIVSALGFNALHASNLLRFDPARGDKEERVLHYSWSYSPAHMGKDAGVKEAGPATLIKIIDELQIVTDMLAKEL